MILSSIGLPLLSLLKGFATGGLTKVRQLSKLSHVTPPLVPPNRASVYPVMVIVGYTKTVAHPAPPQVTFLSSLFEGTKEEKIGMPTVLTPIKPRLS